MAGTPAALKLIASTTALTAVDGTQDAWLLVTVVDSEWSLTAGPTHYDSGAPLRRSDN
jgi:hypothetical protein